MYSILKPKSLSKHESVKNTKEENAQWYGFAFEDVKIITNIVFKCK